MIILAGCFWGCMGIFVRKLGTFGFNPIQIASIRLTVAALVFALVLFFKDRTGFRIALRDLPLFLGLGFGSVLMFTVCYFSAITMMPLSTAAILLYTSPIWIMLMSVLFFKEKLNRTKIVALVLAFAGCVFVSGISGDGVTLSGPPQTNCQWSFYPTRNGPGKRVHKTPSVFSIGNPAGHPDPCPLSGCSYSSSASWLRQFFEPCLLWSYRPRQRQSCCFISKHEYHSPSKITININIVLGNSSHRSITAIGVPDVPLPR